MELRKDYILDRWVIISKTRAMRPHQFKQDESIYANDKGPKECFFCPKNEDKTPGEIGRISEGRGWRMRWFPNKFPAVRLQGKYDITTDNKFFTYSDAYGEHQIIVETQEHDKQMTDFDEEKLVEVLKTYANRIEDMRARPHVKYVTVFKNHGKAAGTSIIHSHSQLISLNIIPLEVQTKVDAVKRLGGCPYCEIINTEKNSHRRVFENDNMVAFTPYASRFNMEVWVFPKNHHKRLDDFTDEDYLDMARCLKHILAKLKTL
ncbi:TPA: galactose-1-phosphate uridylyltransferase, partial [Candidatus Woesearchaeota archaeon]|nr:galactose-1-phosphate uridylyltransferase [Candidatus Woesearchaeota archaeon]